MTKKQASMLTELALLDHDYMKLLELKEKDIPRARSDSGYSRARLEQVLTPNNSTGAWVLYLQEEALQGLWGVSRSSPNACISRKLRASRLMRSFFDSGKSTRRTSGNGFPATEDLIPSSRGSSAAESRLGTKRPVKSLMCSIPNSEAPGKRCLARPQKPRSSPGILHRSRRTAVSFCSSLCGPAAITALWRSSTLNEVPLRLTEGDCFGVRPHFSPDGKTIVFSSSRTGTFDLHVIRTLRIEVEAADDRRPDRRRRGTFSARPAPRSSLARRTKVSTQLVDATDRTASEPWIEAITRASRRTAARSSSRWTRETPTADSGSSTPTERHGFKNSP